MTDEELKQLERPLEHVLKWLAGRSISPTILRYEINECGTSVKRLMSLSGKAPYYKLTNLRTKVSDMTLMMGKLARRISSPNIGDMIQLRCECLSTNKGVYGINLKKPAISAFVAHLVRCLNLLAAELDFMDPAELSSAWPEIPDHTIPDSDCDFEPPDDVDAETANAMCRELAVENLGNRLAGFIEKANEIENCFAAIADAFENSALPEDSDLPDDKSIRHVLSVFTTAFFNVYSPSADGKGLAISGFGREHTKQTEAQAAAKNAIERYLNAALKLAKRLGSSTAKEYAAIRSTFIKHKKKFIQSTDDMAVAGILNDFTARLVSNHHQLLADLEASKIAPDKAVAVTLDERSGKVIESAVHAKPAEKDYFSDSNLRILFECGVNTPANWRRGKSPPEGFTDAFLKRDYKAMQLCAERYKANRAKADAMNSKRLVRNISEEQINRESL